MNPSNSQKSSMGSNKATYLPPGALAIRGRGKTLQSMASVRVRAQRGISIGQSKKFDASTSHQNDPVQDNIIAPPSFDPIEDDVPHPPEVEVIQDTQTNEISACESGKAKRVRGTNICKNVARLKPGEKLSVNFYHNRAVGKNYSSFVRHLGILVRDRNMCPLAVHSWDEIEKDKLDHMWDAVTDKFTCDDMNDRKKDVLHHMRRLWNSWRGSLHKNMKSKPFDDPLKVVPNGVDKSDWEWLVKEHFLSEKFKETSARNSINRSKMSMPHRTGSKPIREVVYELGGKDSKLPSMDTIFFETRKKDDKLVEPETNAKYVEIKKLVQSDSSLTNIEVVEKCFGPQCKGHVVGFGGGITARELKGGNTSKAALIDKLNATQKENESLKQRVEVLENKCERMDDLERQYQQLARIVLPPPSSPLSDQ